MKPLRWTKTAPMLRPDVDPIEVGVWYRSPLWEKSHVLGRREECFKGLDSWCGRAMGYARDWQDEVLGGLYIDERSGDGNYCAHCKNAEKGWQERD